MGIRLKLGEALKLNYTLRTIIDDDTINIDSLFKFNLLGIIKAIEDPVENFNTVRDEIIMKYGERNEEGKIAISTQSKNFKKFNDELTEIINSEITVDINKLKAEDVFSNNFKAEYLISLYPVIEE